MGFISNLYDKDKRERRRQEKLCDFVLFNFTVRNTNARQKEIALLARITYEDLLIKIAKDKNITQKVTEAIIDRADSDDILYELIMNIRQKSYGWENIKQALSRIKNCELHVKIIKYYADNMIVADQTFFNAMENITDENLIAQIIKHCKDYFNRPDTYAYGRFKSAVDIEKLSQETLRLMAENELYDAVQYIESVDFLFNLLIVRKNISDYERSRITERSERLGVKNKKELLQKVVNEVKADEAAAWAHKLLGNDEESGRVLRKKHKSVVNDKNAGMRERLSSLSNLYDIKCWRELIEVFGDPPMLASSGSSYDKSIGDVQSIQINNAKTILSEAKANPEAFVPLWNEIRTQLKKPFTYTKTGFHMELDTRVDDFETDGVGYDGYIPSSPYEL